MNKKYLFTINNQAIYEYTIENADLKLSVLNYGGIITKLIKKKSIFADHNLVLCYSDYRDYLTNPLFFGGIIGRVAGRVFPPNYNFDNQDISLEINENQAHIHGGKSGYHHQFWKIVSEEKSHNPTLLLTYIDKNNSSGYKYDVEISCRYSLVKNQFYIEYTGIPTGKTPINLTNHSYFNLSGKQDKTILHHDLQVNSDYYQEINNQFIPTGRLISTKNHPLNLKKSIQINEVINSNHEQIQKACGGIDLAYGPLIKSTKTFPIKLSCLESKTTLKVKTTEESVVVYTCNKVPNICLLKGFQKLQGITLETQKMPNYLHGKNTIVFYTPKKPYYSYTMFEIE